MRCGLGLLYTKSALNEQLTPQSIITIESAALRVSFWIFYCVEKTWNANCFLLSCLVFLSRFLKRIGTSRWYALYKNRHYYYENVTSKQTYIMAYTGTCIEIRKLIIGSYFTNYSKTITHQAEIFQGKLSMIVIFIPCTGKLCVNLWTFLFFGLTNVVQGL